MDTPRVTEVHAGAVTGCAHLVEITPTEVLTSDHSALRCLAHHRSDFMRGNGFTGSWAQYYEVGARDYLPPRQYRGLPAHIDAAEQWFRARCPQFP